MEDFDWTTTIKTNIFLLKIVGLWPQGDETYKCNLYTTYSIITTLLFTICHNLLRTVTLFFIYKNLTALAATIFLSLTQLLALFKSYYLFQNMEILKQLMVTLNSEMFKPKSAKQKKLIEPNLTTWEFVFKVLWGNACVALVIFSTFPILDHSVKEYPLPTFIWYPYNVQSSPLYEITYFHQVLSTCFICIINVSVGTLIAAINMYIGAQCDILCDDIKNIDGDQSWSKCINHYKEILKFAASSQLLFNWIVLVQFFTSIISIAFTLFQLTVVAPFSNEFYLCVFYLNCIIVEIFMYCWFGNEVELKSTNICYATFESPWVDATVKTQKKMLFFALICQKPIKMSALNLFYLTLDIFIKILRTSWSYFAVLHQVNLRE